ncbi:MAG: tetratricopeptide repeat protein [Saprospiraceae bacterium]|nr:tetratricopeptide repeat protein [Saprospiraceae bacterium]
MYYLRYHIFLVCCFLFSFGTKAQESLLANEYFVNGEYEKAAQLYETLSKTEPNVEIYLTRFIESLINLQQYAQAEANLKKEIKNRPKEMQLYVTYGKLLERQDDKSGAEEKYKQAIQNLTADNLSIIKLANAFTELAKYDFAIQAYEKGSKLLGDKNMFAYSLADLYRRKGDTPKMIEQYLNTLDGSINRLNIVQSMLQRTLSEVEYDELQAQLYTLIQNEPNKVQYPELLSWMFLQRKDYTNALRQAKALDRKLENNGQRIFTLGQIAANDKDYNAAIEAYQYLINKGPATLNYLDAKRELLRCRRLQLTEGYNYSQQDLTTVEMEYESFLQEVGKNVSTAMIVKELADFEALYLNNVDKAISLLNEVIATPGLNQRQLAEAKLSLGDYYLIKDEIWEATLLYSQVDKAFKEDQLGEEARFRNAMLSYYNGDFKWAQAQFDVLKVATSRIISNDAIDRSVFIMDNLNLDTITTPLELYAKAELFTYQNKFDAAFATLDTLRTAFPKHSLDDDILYAKAQIYKKTKNYSAAAEMFRLIIDNYSDEGVRADNALFELADLAQYQMGDIERAKTLYEKLFTDFSNSTFAIEARKRYRQLRGDKVQ